MLYNKAITLVELLIAVSLLGLIFLTAISIDLFTRRQFISTDLETQLQNEISPVMEHMVKNIMQGIGDITNSGVTFNKIQGDDAIEVRIDDDNTPANYNDDIWRVYRFQGTTGSDKYQIWFYPNYINNPNIYSVLATKIVNATFQQLDPANNPQLISLAITARYYPTEPAGPGNPEVNLTTDVSLHSMSIH